MSNCSLSFRIISDIHLNFFKEEMPVIDKVNIVLPEDYNDPSSILIISGDSFDSTMLDCDYGQVMDFFKILSDRFKNVIFVAGNHEYYHSSKEPVDYDLENITKKYANVYFLNKSSVEIDGVVFWGDCFWTPLSNCNEENKILKSHMNDFHLIQDFYNNELEFIKHHNESKESLTRFLEKNSGKKVVIISHHAPDLKSLSSFYKELGNKADLLSKAYYSNMRELILRNKNILFWFHGHTHKSTKYLIGNTLVISNPYGSFGRDVNKDHEKCYLVNFEIDLFF